MYSKIVSEEYLCIMYMKILKAMVLYSHTLISDQFEPPA